MALESHLSAILQVSEGDVLRFFQTFTKDNNTWTVTTPHRFAVPPLTSKIVDFCDVTSAKALLLQTDKPVHVTLTFAATPPTPTPVPATVDRKSVV